MANDITLIIQDGNAGAVTGVLATGINNPVKSGTVYDAMQLSYANSVFDDGVDIENNGRYNETSDGKIMHGLLDNHTNEPVTFTKKTTKPNGDPYTNIDIDRVLVRKKGTAFYVRNFTNVINAKWFGIVADGVRLGDGTFVGTDNTAKFQQIFNYIAATKLRTTVLIPDGNYRTLGTLEFDIKYVSIQGSGARILYDGTTTCLRIFGSQYPPFDQSINYSCNLQLQGKALDVYYIPTDAENTVGVYFNSKGGDTSGGSYHRLSGLVINNFGTGIKYKDDAYNVSLVSSQIASCGIGVLLDDGINNGERITFFDVSIINSTLSVRAANDDLDAYFINCSFDYVVKQIDVLGGKVFCYGCHFETSREESTVVNFTITGNGSSLQIRDSNILQNFTSTIVIPYLFDCGLNSILKVKDCFISGMSTTTGEMATGAGLIEISGITSFNQSNNALITCQANNVLADGGFESTEVVDFIAISDDTATVTNDLVGANINISTSTDTFRTGARSLKIFKQFGPGSNCGCMLLIPVRDKERCAFRFYAKTTTTENKFVSHGYVRIKRMSTGGIYAVRTYEAGAITLTSIPAWTLVKSSDPQLWAPSWADYYYVYFNLFEMSGANTGGGPLYIDDFIITKM